MVTRTATKDPPAPRLAMACSNPSIRSTASSSPAAGVVSVRSSTPPRSNQPVTDAVSAFTA